jgi:hypothetical protein
MQGTGFIQTTIKEITMSTIKNIGRLSGILPEAAIAKLEAAAALHLRHSNITFKIVDVSDTEIHVRAEQGKTLAENYATTHTLVTRTRELFGNFLPDRTVYTHPVAYSTPIVEVVDPEWLKEKMLTKGVKIKDIVTDTGIDKSNISAWVNGIRPMTQIVKAMFYFYFTR